MSFEKKVTWLPVLILLFTSSACGLVGAGTSPDDMSAEEHRRESREHAAAAREHRRRYDPDVQVEPDPGRNDGWGRWRRDYDYREYGDYWGGGSYNPSERHLGYANEHEAHAKKHSEAARVLERFEEAQCGLFPPETRRLCPLIGQMVSVEDIPSGSRVRFAEGIDVDAAVDHMRCHIAFARTRGHTGMESCPLYLEGVRVSRLGPGSEVDFQVEGANKLGALRKRMRGHTSPEKQ